MVKVSNCIVFLLALALVVGTALPAVAATEKVIIKTDKPYDKLVRKIEKAGGTVSYQYRYVDAIAAEVPVGSLGEIRKGLPAGAVRKDLVVAAPDVARDAGGGKRLRQIDAAQVRALEAGDIVSLPSQMPDAYLINNANLNVDPVHGMGYVGSGMRVAVIDSGYRPGFPHIDLDGSVIGGKDMTGDAFGWGHIDNGGHGTFVAGMISANVQFFFSPFFTAIVNSYCPACVDAWGGIPMVGAAPLSDIYAVKVFSPDPAIYTTESMIVAAMEHVLELKENFLNGMDETTNPDGSYNALDIHVCNMSLGGATLYAGRDLEDELTNAFLDFGIVLTTSAGNAGPSGSTGGSPGTGFGSLTVGAASSDVHERIVRDLQYGTGIGALFRPSDGFQTALFSSRGPTADGRPDPEVVANGDWCYGQGWGSPPGDVYFAGGTSFSSPSVAGVAALLREAAPYATARQIRNAIIVAANPSFLVDGSGPLDQGAGLVDAAAALALLESGTVPDTPGLEGGTNRNVKVNVNQGSGVEVYSDDLTRSAVGLLPGQRFETYYRVNPNTAGIVVRLFDVVPGSPQNVFFGDDIILAIHSAKTSRFSSITPPVYCEGDYHVCTFTTGGEFFVPEPESGILRVTLTGDWTNASPIDASVQIFSIKESIPGLTAQSKLKDGEFDVIPFFVPDGASELMGHLSWKGDWGQYPTNDLDAILIDPDGVLFGDGATLDSPERFLIPNPVAGNWLAIVDGFSIFTREDRYKLILKVDGKAVH